MSEQGQSGKRVVIVLLVAAVGVAAIAWLAASRVERKTMSEREGSGAAATATVLSEGVLYEATPGDPGLVIARDVASGKELWRAEVGAVTAQPELIIDGEVVEVEIAGTPWMTLRRSSGEPLE